MKPLLSPTQGRLVKAVVLNLSRDCNKAGIASVLVESIETWPWSSLTFVGERHHLVIRLPGRTGSAVIEACDLIVPGSIVAVADADWTTAADGPVVALDLLTIATTTPTVAPIR